MAVGYRVWLGPEESEALLNHAGLRFDERPFNVERRGRVANGALVIDVIATKRRWTISYDILKQATLDILLTEWGRGTTLNLKVERDDLSVDEYTVWPEPFGYVRMEAMEVTLWQGVKFILEEV